MARPRRQPRTAQRALSFGATVRNLRRKRRLSQRELAEAIPISAGHLSKIELGGSGPPREAVIRRMAEVLDVEATSLLKAAGLRPTNFEEQILAKLEALEEQVAELREELRAGLRRGEERPTSRR